MLFLGYELKQPLLLTKKNHCFVLSNKKFIDQDDLLGYEFDAENIEDTFNGLNFIIHSEENASAEQMKAIFHEWSEIDFHDCECVVVFILSHGHEHGVVYGSDGETIHLDEILSSFSSCEQLKGKPKVFFLQACRGEMNPVAFEDDYVAAGPRLKKNSKFLDMFVYYCTSEGIVVKVIYLHILLCTA